VSLNLFVRCFSLRSTKLEARNDILRLAIVSASATRSAGNRRWDSILIFIPLLLTLTLCVFFAEVRVAWSKLN
jgi:hypothetical protein